MYRHLILLTGLLLGASGHTQTLIDQTGACVNSSGNALSVSFFRSASVESADDFVVPDGKVWRPSLIYAQGSTDLRQRRVNVSIYADADPGLCLRGQVCPPRVPDTPAICTFTGIADFFAPGVGFNPFEIDLPADYCALDEGRYWLSLIHLDDACGSGNNCQDWHWDETLDASDSEPFVIRDRLDTRANVLCSEFGPGSQCLTARVENNLCFEMEGSSEDVLPPQAQSSLVLQTLLVDEPLSLTVEDFFSLQFGQNLVFSADQLPPFLTLSSNGTLSGSADISHVDSHRVFTIRGTDSQGRFDELQVALRIIDPLRRGLGDEFAPGVVVRCAELAPAVGTLTSQLDFSSPGDCGDGAPAFCGLLPHGASVTDARVSLELSHPMISDLKVQLENPQGTSVAIVDRPGVLAINPDKSSCQGANIQASFSDRGTWPAETQCDAPVALVGHLEPHQPLGNFRNQSAVGANGWQLTVDNQGDQPAQINRWCLALQTEPDGLPINPQTGLPGSATYIDFSTQDVVTVSGVLSNDDQVHWYYFDQGAFSREVDAQLTPLNANSVRGYRYPTEKFPGLNPFHAVGDCSQAQVLDFPKYRPNFGLEFYRIQGCPGALNSAYELTVTKDTSVLGRAVLPRLSARFTGEVRDAVSGDLIPQAYVTDGSSATFTSPDGIYSALVDEGMQTVSIFHPDYLPGSVQAVAVEQQTTEVAPVNLSPVSYRAVVNQVIFANDFE